jgi:hypothetical protein
MDDVVARVGLDTVCDRVWAADRRSMHLGKRDRAGT